MDATSAPSFQEIAERLEAIRGLAARHGAVAISVVGSVARGSAQPGSDVDFLVEMAAGRRLFHIGALQFSLQELLGRPVHLIAAKDVPTEVAARMSQDARRL
jgi:predicted nucleotidyltransferase